MLWWRHEHGAVKFPKTWRGTLGYRPKIHHFFFSHKWDTRFKYLSKLCPYILMYSALHIMQWFSHSLDVFTPKIKRKFFDFYILWIKTNVAYTRLEMIARTKYCTTTTASNWFVTLYYKLLPAVRSPSKHGRWWSSLLLYSISMGRSWKTAINVLVWRTPLNTVSDEKHKKSKILICIFHNKSQCLLMFINISIQINSDYIILHLIFKKKKIRLKNWHYSWLI